MTDDWRALVEVAATAPSPHNTQPWRVRVVSDSEAELYVPAARTLPATDASGAFMTCTAGIFVEALDIAASARGLTVEAEPLFPNLGAGATAEPLFARLRLLPRSEPSPSSPGDLARRRTHRGAFEPRPVERAALDTAAGAAAAAGHEARFTDDPASVGFVVELNADTLFDDLDDEATRAEIGRWIRRSNRDAARARDGFSPAALGFPGALVSLFFFHHALFRPRTVRAFVRRLFLRTTRGTRTVGWLRGPWRTPEDHYAAGRMLLRLWLELTRRDVYVQPFGSVVTNARAHARLVERLGAEETDGEIWLVLRLGYGSPPAKSHRLPLAEVLA